ncbi:hypothetical protein V5E97_26275 [Singulisphaera sp. Ch08]|uniref:Transposase n=1 Tax=Singulisphaera sp. Ch08 TaxID=3120278 RepID=A0AAU7C9M9_9BACT
MRTKTHEDILIEALSAGRAADGTGVVRTIFLAALAEHAADLRESVAMHPNWVNQEA